MKHVFGRPRAARDLRRESKGFLPLTRVLIVCEGDKTEPNYLKEYCRSLGLTAAMVEVVGSGSKSAPISLYNYASQRLGREEFDETFCVLDRDRHQTFDETIQRIASHGSGRLRAIVSYPCFEYWIPLHFRYSRAPFVEAGKKSPGDMVLEALLRDWPEYAKGATGVFRHLDTQGLTGTATANARRARADVESTGEPNPSTDIDLLLLRLQEIAASMLKPADGS